MSLRQTPSEPATARQPFTAGWTGGMVVGLVVYALAAVLVPVWFAGAGRAFEVFTLFSDLPMYAGSALLAVMAARSARSPPARLVWQLLAASLAVYGTGNLLNSIYWYFGRDPFPSVGDVFFLSFYPLLFAAVLTIVRSSAVRAPWGRLLMDGTILVLGFGAFFWFFVIEPSSLADTDPDIVKYVLAQTYIALACLMVLTFGVFLMNAGAGPLARRTLVLMTIGFCLMFLADIVWAMSKVTGQYLPGGLSDALYVLCYIGLAAAAREHMRGPPTETQASTGAIGSTLSQALPYLAMIVSFLLLVYFQRGNAGEPTKIMTVLIFALTLLVMLRQGVILRDEALLREQRAAGLVEARYASLIRNASDVIMIADVHGRLRFVSPAAEHAIGKHPDELVGRRLHEICISSEQDRLLAFLAEVAASSGRPVGPIELSVGGGAGRSTMEAVGTNLLADPAVGGLALNFRDVSERKVLEEQLSQLAFHDSLTLLANRSLFRNRVEHALALAQRANRQVAVLFLDLDNFKNVNDSHGHGAGDRLLQTAAQRLVMCTRATDTVARLGGDEFAILLEGVTRPEDVEHIAAMIIDLFSAPLVLDGNDIVITASIGIACSEPNDDTERLLRNADIAMYNAKAAGKGRYVVFQTRMQEQLHERLRLVQDIHRAIEQDEFFLEFQPIIDLTSRELLGVETLVRWQHPGRGLVMPGEFIAAAEESGQIVELGRWVLSDACRRIRAWQGSIVAGHAIRVAVNISGRHLQQPDFVADVRRVLEGSGLEPENLVIELTESTIMQNTEANLEKFQELKKLGVRLSIDDFGTGYSSLSYLHRFPIDILKIDRSFVSRLTEAGEGPELARAVVMLGETLGLETIAEGIEEEEQVKQLLELGCVAGQGFLFARSCALEILAASPFALRRAELRGPRAAEDDLTATGRFRAMSLRTSDSAA